MKRKSVVLIVMAFALLFAQGCAFPEAYPIEKEQTILIAGIDVENGSVVLTVLVDSISAGGKSGEEQIKYKLYQTTGSTVFEADDKLHQFMEKRPSWYHTKYVILGEEAAKSGADRLLSFFEEDDETRILYRAAVIKGMTAKDYLQQANTGKDDLSEYFDTLFSAVNQTGKSREIHLINYIISRQTPWVSAYMPALELQKNPVKPQSSSGGSDSGGSGSDSGEKEYITVLNGFALFNGDDLAGYMSGDFSRGLNILTNDINNSGIAVQDREGNGVGLELTECSSKIIPSFNPLSATVEVNITSNLVEYHRVNPVSESDIDYLEFKQSELICDEISHAIKCMQNLKSDPARIMDAFYHSDPVSFQSIKNDWKNIFSNLNITVKVNSQIVHTYEMTEPVSGGED